MRPKPQTERKQAPVLSLSRSERTIPSLYGDSCLALLSAFVSDRYMVRELLASSLSRPDSPSSFWSLWYVLACANLQSLANTNSFGRSRAR
ncbi:hypothetical protein J6590_106394 [Homalodisca vitripennis]|nr:hypothetical protein J6590_106394 [Homalodisca vitripennis]